MPLLNYTTTIKVDKTVGEIQAALAEHGANRVVLEYDGGDVVALTFSMQVPMSPGQRGELSFRLPANIDAVFKLLDQNARVARKYKTTDQARRVAWRILKRWVDAQMALIATKMVKTEQVFLGYVVNPASGQTLFGVLEREGFQKLLVGPGSKK